MAEQHNRKKKRNPKKKTAAAAERRLEASAEVISRGLIDKALSGDMDSARLVLERTISKPGDRRTSIPLRDIANARDAELAMFDVLQAAAEERMSLSQARAVIKTLRLYLAGAIATGGVKRKKTFEEKFFAHQDEKFRLVAERLRPPKALGRGKKNAAAVSRENKKRPIKTKDCSSDSDAPDRATDRAYRRLERAAESIVDVVIDRASAGDPAAVKLVLDFGLQPQSKPVVFPMRQIQNRRDAKDAKSDVIAAMAKQSISVEAAAAFSRLLDQVVNAPKVPAEVVGTEELETFFEGLVPILQQTAIQRQKGVSLTSLYEIWLESVERRRATRSLPF